MQQELLAGGTAVCISEYHRFGQDALLLADFCGVRRAEAVCDLGTGCGIIPLRWHDRGHRGPCLALDIASDAVALLRAACEANGIVHITPLQADLRVRETLYAHEQSMDVVCCNPPYFTGGIVSPDKARAQARHELCCTTADICASAGRLLKDGGRLCLCQRPERLTDVLTAMRAARIEPKRLRFVAAQPHKEPWLFLAEGRKNRAPGLHVLPPFITMRGDGAPSDEILAVYGRQRKEDAP